MTTWSWAYIRWASDLDLKIECDNFVRPQAIERNGFAPYPPFKLHRLPSKQLPHPHEVAIWLETGRGGGRPDVIAARGGMDLNDGQELEREGRKWRIWEQESKSGGNLNLPTRFLSLPTPVTLRKMSCAVPGAITPVQPAQPMMRGPWVHLSDGAGQTIGNSRK
jgi:hypothetical protein